MAKDIWIKVRMSEQERDHAKRVADAVDKSLSAIMRQAIENLAKRHGIKDPSK